MLKFIIEGNSAINMEEALAAAMKGAAAHLSEESDILISLVEQKMKRGGTCHIALEVTTLPPGTQGRDRAPRQVTAQEIAAKDYSQRKAAEMQVAWKKRIIDHFRRRLGVEANSARIHLENLHEFAIMGQIEREFFNIAHAENKQTAYPIPEPPHPDHKHEKEPE